MDLSHLTDDELREAIQVAKRADKWYLSLMIWLGLSSELELIQVWRDAVYELIDDRIGE